MPVFRRASLIRERCVKFQIGPVAALSSHHKQASFGQFFRKSIKSYVLNISLLIHLPTKTTTGPIGILDLKSSIPTSKTTSRSCSIVRGTTRKSLRQTFLSVRRVV